MQWWQVNIPLEHPRPTTMKTQLKYIYIFSFSTSTNQSCQKKKKYNKSELGCTQCCFFGYYIFYKCCIMLLVYEIENVFSKMTSPHTSKSVSYTEIKYKDN